MRRHLHFVFGLAIIFFLERGAEMMWSNVSPWTWWSLAALSALVWALTHYGIDFFKSRKLSSKSQSLELKPINRSYDWLSENVSYEDEGYEEEKIPHSLEQAAIDEKITIWGSEPCHLAFEEEKPMLQKISPSYWVKHKIARDRLDRSADHFPDEGHVTCRRSSGPPNPDDQIYWHLRVDMNEIKARWKQRRNE